MNVDCSTSHQYVCETAMVSAQSADTSSSSGYQDTMLWSLLAPLTILAGGFLFYICSKWKAKRRGPDHQYLPEEESEQISSTHSLVHDQTNGTGTGTGTRSPQQMSAANNGKYLSKYNYDQTSPEETMEIQLQMRSYAPLTQNSV